MNNGSVSPLLKPWRCPSLELEQIERLRSEDTPRRLPLSHIGSQVQRRQSQSYNIKEFAKIKFLNFETSITCDTPSEVAW